MGAIVAWCIAGSGMLMLASVFQTLSRRKPELDGGIYAYAKAGFGNHMGFTAAFGYCVACCLAQGGVLPDRNAMAAKPGSCARSDCALRFGAATAPAARAEPRPTPSRASGKLNTPPHWKTLAAPPIDVYFIVAQATCIDLEERRRKGDRYRGRGQHNLSE